MSSPESEDTPGPDAGAPDATARDCGAAGPADAAGARGPALPDDVDAAFAGIVAAWAADDAPRWPDASPDPAGGGPGVGLATPPPVAPWADPPAARPSGSDDPRPEPDPVHRPPTGPGPDAEHFVPPEPPPLPRVGASSLVGLLLLVVGVVLLAVPGLMGDALGLGIVPGLLAMTAGLGWLVFGMRRASDRDDPDAGGTL